MTSEEEIWRQRSREHARQYYQNNRERILERDKEYRERNKALLKARYEERKDEINARRRANPKRKEYIKMYNSLKVKCSCGVELLKQNLLRHLQSKQHIEAPTKVRQMLEKKTNPDIADLIMSYL